MRSMLLPKSSIRNELPFGNSMGSNHDRRLKQLPGKKRYDIWNDAMPVTPLPELFR